MTHAFIMDYKYRMSVPLAVHASSHYQGHWTQYPREASKVPQLSQQLGSESIERFSSSASGESQMPTDAV